MYTYFFVKPLQSVLLEYLHINEFVLDVSILINEFITINNTSLHLLQSILVYQLISAYYKDKLMHSLESILHHM